jgi:hypothetical protein
MKPRSCAKDFAGTCKEMLGTAVSVGCTVDHSHPSEIIDQVRAQARQSRARRQGRCHAGPAPPPRALPACRATALLGRWDAGLSHRLPGAPRSATCMAQGFTCCRRLPAPPCVLPQINNGEIEVPEE